MFTRTRYQYGSLEPKERSNGETFWEFRFYDTDNNGKRSRRSVTVGTLRQYPTESLARKSPAVQAIMLRLNSEHPCCIAAESLFGALLARYEQEEMPERHSTATSYRSFIKNYIRPRWADVPISGVRAMAVEDWLKRLTLAPKTRSHIRSLMHTIFRCGERWELLDRNPIELVRVKGGSRRMRSPLVLTVEQFHSVRHGVPEPYRTMVLVGGCLGLRASELMALQWPDIDFGNLTILVQRSIVHGRVDDVKTEYSRDRMPLHPALAQALLRHNTRCPPTPEEWVFANPATGWPYHQDSIQKKHLRTAGRAAGLGDHIGWHTLRHTYRSWLDETGAPLGVQKELMRHASITTTMNIYGRAMASSKREANSKIVQLLLPEGTATVA